MWYHIAPNAWADVFALPAQIVDNHIKMASGAQLKVLLWIVRHNAENFDLNDISKAIGLSAEDIKDNVQYWVESGIVCCGSEDLKILEKPEPYKDHKEISKKQENGPQKQLEPLPDITPTYEQVASRIEESQELKYLCLETQIKLGRTIGYDTQALLLMAHDNYGLPAEVILTIIEYAVSLGKTSKAYMAKVFKDWGEREIDTLEKADEQLQRICEDQTRWKKFAGLFSFDPPKFTDKRSQYLREWNKTLGFTLEMIFTAYEETLNKINKINFAYTDSILKSWHEQEFKTPDDVLKAQRERLKQYKADSTTSKNSGKKASYDWSKYEKKANGPIEFKRRKG
ncbi:MAG: DnaD domain protein [Oscillospiraceae bacterium]|jgi:DnaD/phage-associated family protein|nr:DnaD domain protein [Oscillospiraceae bacterium]